MPRRVLQHAKCARMKKPINLGIFSTQEDPYLALWEFSHCRITFISRTRETVA